MSVSADLGNREGSSDETVRARPFCRLSPSCARVNEPEVIQQEVSHDIVEYATFRLGGRRPRSRGPRFRRWRRGGCDRHWRGGGRCTGGSAGRPGSQRGDEVERDRPEHGPCAGGQRFGAACRQRVHGDGAGLGLWRGQRDQPTRSALPGDKKGRQEGLEGGGGGDRGLPRPGRALPGTARYPSGALRQLAWGDPGRAAEGGRNRGR